ncbi:MAG: signal transduction histidine kinase [Bacteriovoracaceae bacterium]|jgi:signal transduction histidine kinase
MSSDVKILAHDINNQMMVVKLVVGQLIKELFSPKASKQKAVSLSRKLEISLDKIIISCKEAMDGEAIEEVRLSECIQKALLYCESYDVETDFLKQRDPVKEISANAFERVLINLFKNSIETEADKIMIELRENFLLVKDNGGGVTQDQIKDFRSGNFSSTKEEGHGLGLKSLYDFCERVNWKAEITNFDYLHERKKKGLKVQISF